MWTQEQTTFKGDYYKIRGAYCNPMPSPRPPIMIGGGGEKLTLKVVAKYADWWNLSGGTVHRYRHKLNILTDHCRKVGRDLDEIKKTLGGNVSISTEEEKAVEMASRSPFIGDIESGLVGTPEMIVEELNEFIESGVEHFIFRFVDFPKIEGARLFVDKVIGRLR